MLSGLQFMLSGLFWHLARNTVHVTHEQENTVSSSSNLKLLAIWFFFYWKKKLSNFNDTYFYPSTSLDQLVSFVFLYFRSTMLFSSQLHWSHLLANFTDCRKHRPLLHSNNYFLSSIVLHLRGSLFTGLLVTLNA